jgi:hypothetical protein
MEELQKWEEAFLKDPLNQEIVGVASATDDTDLDDISFE